MPCVKWNWKSGLRFDEKKRNEVRHYLNKQCLSKQTQQIGVNKQSLDQLTRGDCIIYLNVTIMLAKTEKRVNNFKTKVSHW